MTLRAGFEYDTNVLLKPSETSLVTDITDESDTRQFVDLKGDYTFKPKDSTLNLKTGYGFHFAKQNDLGKYDTMTNNVSLQPNISLEKVLVTFPANYSHTVVDEKNYLSAVTAGNINNILFGKSYMGQLGVVYKFKDYLRTTSGDEDRSGNELLTTGGIFYFFAKNEGFLGLRYSINKDWTEGENWEYVGHKISASIL